MKFWFKGKENNEPNKILETGWQFYHRPTTLEPIGTVFRIDSDNKRFDVDTLDIPSTRGLESESHLESNKDINLGAFLKILSVSPKIGGNANLAEKVEFQMRQPERETTKDSDVDKILEPYLKSMKYRTDNRYFLIRACYWASGMTYRLSKDRLLDLGGEGKINEALGVQANLKTVGESMYEIDHAFPQPMRVMFLPEEIKVTSAGLGGDEAQLGRVQVREQLVWKD